MGGRRVLLIGLAGAALGCASTLPARATSVGPDVSRWFDLRGHATTPDGTVVSFQVEVADPNDGATPPHAYVTVTEQGAWGSATLQGGGESQPPANLTSFSWDPLLQRVDVTGTGQAYMTPAGQATGTTSGTFDVVWIATAATPEVLNLPQDSPGGPPDAGAATGLRRHNLVSGSFNVVGAPAEAWTWQTDDTYGPDNVSPDDTLLQQAAGLAGVSSLTCLGANPVIACA